MIVGPITVKFNWFVMFIHTLIEVQGAETGLLFLGLISRFSLDQNRREEGVQIFLCSFS